ncbi:ectonucleoside triphosphate diphosphohydrolase 6 isoform X9 [Pan paniscus]|uniref:ectonucleoside triphosphate diphosphohydrolase 6 isoform X9 n=1 Tax=Pan paniscus TaxID=9597 RepID=UPI002436B1C0|nr:ectonucleoside triphosphate diphosphohydrolase 6 isoform X9 [Pan paniscus]
MKKGIRYETSRKTSYSFQQPQHGPWQTRMRKISNHGSLRVAKVAYPLGLCVGVFIYVAYIKWHRATATQAFFSITRAAPGARWGQQAHSPLGTAADGHEVFYGIMFDAGSTGTRVHVFQFTRPPRETPTLTHETFKALKPGLSAYADDVEKSAQGIQELLDVAKQDIPFDFWKATPLVLKATAGLRLLPGEKAQKLLQKVKEVFKASPFLVGDDCVSIMNGTDEGVSAWITINFLTGSLKTPGGSSVGMLDLGGGSTQIAFLPRVEGTLQASPPGYLTALRMFNRTYKLYSYSYLGLGLMSARLAILGGVEGQPGWKGVGQPLLVSQFQRRVGTRRSHVQGFRAESSGKPARAVCCQSVRGPSKQSAQDRGSEACGLLCFLLLLRPCSWCGPHRCGEGRQPGGGGLRDRSQVRVSDPGDTAAEQPLRVHGPHLRQPATPGVRLSQEQSTEAHSEN